MVLKDVTHQILEGNQSIIGVMLESNLHFGNQSIPKDLSQLKYGVSVTDACIDWAETERVLREMAGKLRTVLPGRTCGSEPARD
jgi:3-deoxy-7-phosphoheptulonate synthase